MTGIKIINEIVHIPQDHVNQCKEHAEKFSESRVYQDSFQTNADKIKQDAFYGKLAEFAVYHRFIQNNFECSKPDLEIYEKNKRSWSSDIVVKIHDKMYHISVKTCENQSNSWVFQADFSGRYDKSVFDSSKNHVIALTQVVDESQVLIFAFIKAEKSLELMRLPRLRKLFGKKLCLYKDNIKKETILTTNEEHNNRTPE